MLDPGETHSYFYQIMRIRIPKGIWMAKDEETVMVLKIIVDGKVDYACTNKTPALELLS